MNIDVGRDFFDVAIASGSFGISLASAILSFMFMPEQRSCERLDYLQRHHASYRRGQPVHCVSGYKDLVAALVIILKFLMFSCLGSRGHRLQFLVVAFY